MNDDQSVSNHDETLPNDDKIITHHHYPLLLNDSEEVQNVANLVNDDEIVSNYDETVPNDDKNIAHRHYSLSLNDAAIGLHTSTAPKNHSAQEKDGSGMVQNDPAQAQDDSTEGERSFRPVLFYGRKMFVAGQILQYGVSIEDGVSKKRDEIALITLRNPVKLHQ